MGIPVWKVPIGTWASAILGLRGPGFPLQAHSGAQGPRGLVGPCGGLMGSGPLGLMRPRVPWVPWGPAKTHGVHGDHVL